MKSMSILLLNNFKTFQNNLSIFFIQYNLHHVPCSAPFQKMFICLMKDEYIGETRIKQQFSQQKKYENKRFVKYYLQSVFSVLWKVLI